MLQFGETCAPSDSELIVLAEHLAQEHRSGIFLGNLNLHLSNLGIVVAVVVEASLHIIFVCARHNFAVVICCFGGSSHKFAVAIHLVVFKFDFATCHLAVGNDFGTEEIIVFVLCAPIRRRCVKRLF